MEFRASVNADSGIFIRRPQLQCRDYLVAGPYKTLKQYRPQDWNEIVVTVKGGAAGAKSAERTADPDRAECAGGRRERNCAAQPVARRS